MNILDLVESRPDAIVCVIPTRYIRRPDGEMHDRTAAQKWVMTMFQSADFVFENHGDYLTVFKSRDPHAVFDLNSPKVDDDQIDEAVASIMNVIKETDT